MLHNHKLLLILPLEENPDLSESRIRCGRVLFAVFVRHWRWWRSFLKTRGGKTVIIVGRQRRRKVIDRCSLDLSSSSFINSHFEIVVMVVRTDEPSREKKSRSAHRTCTYMSTTTVSIHPMIISDKQNKRSGAHTACICRIWCWSRRQEIQVSSGLLVLKSFSDNFIGFSLPFPP